MDESASEPVRYAVITVSDRCASGERDDRSGPAAVECLDTTLGTRPLATCIVPDDRSTLERELIRLADEAHCHLIVTSGGTGLAPRDITPEATHAVIDREVPGLAEAMRAEGLRHTPRAMLSRATCGQRGRTIIINLSGSPKAVREQLAVVAPVLTHAIETASGRTLDCGK